ncbi:hypothetical protein [Saccharothrix hoggarensis]|uniref:Uncharacterized protein n=1 Tax=Saccharothrix hoggarensis TaxID=913853 RepID=A0ABW3R0S7_9PSEU
MLLRIAHALGIDDLAQLTGDHTIPVQAFAGERHAALYEVQGALTEYHFAAPDRPLPDLAHLAVRLDMAWRVRHSSSDHRTQLGTLLPGLIRDAQTAVRTSGEKRREARRLLAGVYQLADFYVAYQPRSGVGVVGRRPCPDRGTGSR